MDKIRLLLNEFYKKPAEKVIYNKIDRKVLERKANTADEELDLTDAALNCHALYDQIHKSWANKKNLQSAVLAECSLIQTFANMMGINNCENFTSNFDLNNKIRSVLQKNNILPRYVYFNDDKSKLIFQAGGPSGPDCLYVDNNNKQYWVIEVKENYAKTHENDLPPYGENGKLVVTKEFLAKCPQFKKMLDENKDLNFFDNLGHNIHSFSKEAISESICFNGVDFILTEDSNINGYLILIPVQDIKNWASLEGEIRPAGRNPYGVTTPKKLRLVIKHLRGTINDDTVEMPLSSVEGSGQRGNVNVLSRYKFYTVFFVRTRFAKKDENKILFNINDVEQLRPTIASKVKFDKVSHNALRQFYLKS